jgi:hypothetical protein
LAVDPLDEFRMLLLAVINTIWVLVYSIGLGIWDGVCGEKAKKLGTFFGVVLIK